MPLILGKEVKMTEYRFCLEPYKGFKHRCPNCGQKSFVRYIDNETGEYLSDEVGKCDREDKCGYHYPPREYFAEHPKERVKLTIKRMHMTSHKEAHKPTKTVDIDDTYVIRSQSDKSNFVCFLKKLFDCDTVERLITAYRIGAAKDGSVIFWQIDTSQAVHTGKMMQYDPETGHRRKDVEKPVDWIHSRLKATGQLPADWELVQCLFGEHLLPDNPDATVCLVESEKTAIICAAVFPDYIWLATGGKQNLNDSVCQCLKGRNVAVFPDLMAFDKWKGKVKGIARTVGFTVYVSDILENMATDEEKQEGLDIADYLIDLKEQEDNTYQLAKDGLYPLTDD